MVLLDNGLLLDDKKRELTRREKWGRRIVKFIVILTVLFFVGVGLLSRMGGDSDTLKKGLESFLSGSTGLVADVGVFHGLTFFPSVSTYAEDIVLHPQKDRPAMTIGSLKFSRGFWDTFLSRPAIEDIAIEKIALGEGYLTPLALRDGMLTVAPDAVDNGPGLAFTGHYGGQAVSFTLAMDYDGTGPRPRFTLRADAPFVFIAGPLHIRGTAGRGHWGGLMFAITDMTVDGDEDLAALQPLSGSLFLLRRAEDIATTIVLKSKGSTMNVTLHHSRSGNTAPMAADIGFPVLALAEAPLFADLAALLGNIYYGDRPGIHLSPMALTLGVEKLTVGEKALGRFAMNGTVSEDSVFHAAAISGTIAGGALGGTLTLDAQKPEAAMLTARLALEGWRYGADGAASGNSAALALTAQGGSLKALRAALAGTITAEGGAARMDAQTLDLWDSGLRARVLPDAMAATILDVQCLRVHFDVKKGIATATDIFLKTADAGIAAHGTLDLRDRTRHITFSRADALSCDTGAVPE